MMGTQQLIELLKGLTGHAVVICTIGCIHTIQYRHKLQWWIEKRKKQKYLVLADEDEEETFDIDMSHIVDVQECTFVNDKEILFVLDNGIEVQVYAA